MKIIIYFVLFFVFFSFNSLSASKKTDAFILTEKIHDFLKKENFFNDKDDIDIMIHTPLNQKIKYCQKPIFSLLSHMRTLGILDLLLTCDQSKYYLTVEIQAQGKYVVTNKYIPRGMTIKESDLTILTGRLDKLPNHVYRNKKDIIGRVNIRNLFPFQIITSLMTRPFWLVRINQEITIIVKGNNFTITTKGKSLSNGAYNDKIRVKINTGKIVYGIVNHKGELMVSI